MLLCSRTLIAAVACLLLPIALAAVPAPARSTGVANAAEVAMPTVVGPGGGVTAHDASNPVSIWYAGSFYGRYALVVRCVSAADAAPVRWVERHRWRGSFRQEKQEFRPVGGLPPGATCTALVRRDADGARTDPLTFEVVWGEGALHLEPPTAPTLWPAPADGGQRQTWVLHVREPGSYGVAIASSDGTDVAAHHFGQLPPGRHSWTWDATGRDEAPVAEGGYVASADGHYPSDTGEEYVAIVPRPFEVRYATDVATGTDRRRETRSHHVDLAAYVLANGPRRVSVSYRFRTLRRAALDHLGARLDVDRSRRGYLLTVDRGRRGRLRPALASADLASQAGRPRPIRCRGLDFDLARREITVTVPRTCLDRGGAGLRGSVTVGDRHDHVDGAPDSGREPWSRWTVYETPPAG